MDNALTRLKVNLKNWSFDVEAKYGIDENEARQLIAEIETKEDVVSVLEDIKADLWMAGFNMAGEYQGVWVRFNKIDEIFAKYLEGKNDND